MGVAARGRSRVPPAASRSGSATRRPRPVIRTAGRAGDLRKRPVSADAIASHAAARRRVARADGVEVAAFAREVEIARTGHEHRSEAVCIHRGQPAIARRPAKPLLMAEALHDRLSVHERQASTERPAVSRQKTPVQRGTPRHGPAIRRWQGARTLASTGTGEETASRFPQSLSPRCDRASADPRSARCGREPGVRQRAIGSRLAPASWEDSSDAVAIKLHAQSSDLGRASLSDVAPADHATTRGSGARSAGWRRVPSGCGADGRCAARRTFVPPSSARGRVASRGRCSGGRSPVSRLGDSSRRCLSWS